MQPDVGDLLKIDRRQRLRHSVDERLGADEPAARIGLRLRDQVLSAAESDLQAHVVDRDRKQRRQTAGRRVEVQREARQQRVEQLRLPRAQRMALAPAKERPVMMRVVVTHRAS